GFVLAGDGEPGYVGEDAAQQVGFASAAADRERSVEAERVEALDEGICQPLIHASQQLAARRRDARTQPSSRGRTVGEGRTFAARRTVGQEQYAVASGGCGCGILFDGLPVLAFE